MAKPCGATPLIRKANFADAGHRGALNCNCGRFTATVHVWVWLNRLLVSVRTIGVRSVTRPVTVLVPLPSAVGRRVRTGLVAPAIAVTFVSHWMLRAWPAGCKTVRAKSKGCIDVTE